MSEFVEYSTVDPSSRYCSMSASHQLFCYLYLHPDFHFWASQVCLVSNIAVLVWCIDLIHLLWNLIPLHLSSCPFLIRIPMMRDLIQVNILGFRFGSVFVKRVSMLSDQKISSYISSIRCLQLRPSFLKTGFA